MTVQVAGSVADKENRLEMTAAADYSCPLHQEWLRVTLVALTVDFWLIQNLRKGLPRITLGDLVNRKQDYVEAENAGS